MNLVFQDASIRIYYKKDGFNLKQAEVDLQVLESETILQLGNHVIIYRRVNNADNRRSES